MNNTLFFQIQQISNDTVLLNEFKDQNIFYSYFQVDQNYYLFVYSQTNIQIDFLYQLVQVIQELDSKQRKIRSFRGFFLYALEIMETGKECEILNTNLQPFFWRKVKNIIRQNKKSALQEFLFGYDSVREQANTSTSEGLSTPFQEMKEKIQNLQNQVTLLQQKVIKLEAKLDAHTLSGSGKKNNASYFQENHQGINEPHTLNSNTLSEESKIDFKAPSPNEEYNLDNLYPDQSKAKNIPNFITLSNLSENEKIEIIKTGFQLQAEGKISLKKYYESTDPDSLVQLRGYKIKYETIRRTKLYQQLKF